MTVRPRLTSRIFASLIARVTFVSLTATSFQETPTASATTSTVVAQVGSRGEKVKSIQRAVNAYVDGIYGKKTAAAVKVWQKSHRLSVTGVVDLATWAKMRPPTQLVGNDVSWPQCPRGMGVKSRRTEGKKMPGSAAKFIVIGLTNGLGFYANPCLASQVAWAKKHHVYTAPYAFTTYPTSAQLRKYGAQKHFKGTGKVTKLKNAGYAEAQFNVANMHKAGLNAPFVWVDVEYSRAPATWSTSRRNNKAVLEGVFAGYKAAGMKMGIYSSADPWRTLIGSARYKVPEWRTVGPASKSAALRKCKASSVQGGHIVLGQWWIDDSPTANGTDYNVLCRGYSSAANLKLFFTKF